MIVASFYAPRAKETALMKSQGVTTDYIECLRILDVSSSLLGLKHLVITDAELPFATFKTELPDNLMQAMLTGIARGSKLFQDAGVDDFFTFFDLAKLFGFEQITVSNGRDYAHQIEIK